MTVEASPAGALRERPVPCRSCGRPTWNYSARCGCRRPVHSALCVDDDGKVECVCGLEP